MKTIKVEVPDEIWEAFYRVLPGVGERSSFLRKLIEKTIELESESDCFRDAVLGEVLRDLGAALRRGE